MLALTVHRPWGHAILRLGKDIENRDWRPPDALIGERFAVHQGKRWDDESATQIQKLTGCARLVSTPEAVAMGLIGTVRLAGWFRIEACRHGAQRVAGASGISTEKAREWLASGWLRGSQPSV